MNNNSLSLYSKPKKMQLEYTEFYNLLWGYYINETDVSIDYRLKNKEFINMVTFSLWNKYKSKNISEAVYAESIKIFFQNMFLFNPDTFDNGEVKDWNKSK